MSTTISVVPELNNAAHVNVSGVIHRSFNTTSSQEGLQLQVGKKSSQGNNLVGLDAMSNLPAVGYDLGQPQFQAFHTVAEKGHSKLRNSIVHISKIHISQN